MATGSVPEAAVTGHPATALRGLYLLASTEPEYQAVTETLRSLPLAPAGLDAETEPAGPA